MTLTEESRTTTVVKRATHQGFDIRFSYQEGSDTLNPVNINAHGSKTVDGKNVNFNASVNNMSSNISYSGMQPDSALATDVFTELNKILNQTV